MLRSIYLLFREQNAGKKTAKSKNIVMRLNDFEFGITFVKYDFFGSYPQI